MLALKKVRLLSFFYREMHSFLCRHIHDKYWSTKLKSLNHWQAKKTFKRVYLPLKIFPLK